MCCVRVCVYVCMLVRWLVDGHGRAVLRLEREDMRFRGGPTSEFPTSSCARPCAPDRILVRAKEDPCCWRCQSCGLYGYKVDEQRCGECEWGTRPTSNGTGCETIPEQFIDHSNPWAIAAMAIAVSGNAANRS